jgi:CheY-like chemotaxis protein
VNGKAHAPAPGPKGAPGSKGPGAKVAPGPRVSLPSIPRVARYAPSAGVTPRKVWILGCDSERVGAAVSYLIKKGHDARGGEPGGDVGSALRTERPDLVVIDLETDSDRGRHVAVQLRADRGTRQLPIFLVGVRSNEGPKVDRAVPGPTRRYAGTLIQPTVLEAIYKDL